MIAGLPQKPLLEVDGGVNLQNISAIAQAGADVLVAGAAVFGTADYAQTITSLKAAAQRLNVGAMDVAYANQSGRPV